MGILDIKVRANNRALQKELRKKMAKRKPAPLNKDGEDLYHIGYMYLKDANKAMLKAMDLMKECDPVEAHNLKHILSLSTVTAASLFIKYRNRRPR